MAIEKDIAIHHTDGVENVVRYVDDPEKTDVMKHGYAIAGDMKYDIYKIEEADRDIVNALDYASNLEKTVLELDGDQDILVSGIACNPDTAAFEFQLTRDRYYRMTEGEIRVHGTKTDKRAGERVNKESIEAYHVIQSFPAINDLDPRLVHQIGKEYAEKAFQGHQCVVTTHTSHTQTGF